MTGFASVTGMEQGLQETPRPTNDFRCTKVRCSGVIGGDLSLLVFEAMAMDRLGMSGRDWHKCARRLLPQEQELL